MGAPAPTLGTHESRAYGHSLGGFAHRHFSPRWSCVKERNGEALSHPCKHCRLPASGPTIRREREEILGNVRFYPKLEGGKQETVTLCWDCVIGGLSWGKKGLLSENSCHQRTDIFDSSTLLETVDSYNDICSNPRCLKF